VSPDDWKGLGELLGLLVLGGFTAYKAHKSAKYAKPTGNGFAGKVLDQLEELKAGQSEANQEIAIVKTIAIETREVQRDDRKVLMNHLVAHAETAMKKGD
jgi:hypothetical protein